MRRAERAQAEGGFTLIEVIVVLVILGLMAGLVLSRGPPHSATIDMRRASTLVIGALRVARSQAIARNGPVPVRFDAAGATLQVDNEPVRKLPVGIRIVSGAKLILFRPDGSSSGGRIELAGEARTARIGVNWLTGRVGMTP